MSKGMLIFLHVLFFFILAFAVAAVVSAYRESEPAAIWRGTMRRMAKVAGFTAILAGGMFLAEWTLFRWLG